MDDEIRDKGQRVVIVRATDTSLWVHCQDEDDVHWMCKAVVDAHSVPKDRSVN